MDFPNSLTHNPFLLMIFFYCFLRISLENNIDVCYFTSYDPIFVQTLKLPLNRDASSLNSDCILKNPSFQSRKIFVNNASNLGNSDKASFYDEIYSNLAQAFENETRVLSEYLTSNLEIVLEMGVHFLQNSDFTVDEEEIFRRILCNVSISTETAQAINLRLNSNSFYLFISSNFVISNINFIGNDINWLTNDQCLNNLTTTCCQESDFTIDYPTNSLAYNSQCYVKNRFLPDTQKLNYYGLFNLEYIADNTLNIQPNLTLLNCKFTNFFLMNTNGFISLVSLAPLSGNLFLDSVILENTLFPQGVIFSSIYDFDTLYSSFSFDAATQNNSEESIIIYNSSTFDYNIYTVTNDIELFFFSISNFNGNITLDSCFLTSMVNITTIFNIANLGSQVNFEIKDTIIQNISQSILFWFTNVQLLLGQNLTISQYQNFEIEVFIFESINMILFQNLNLSDVLLDNSTNCFEITDSFLSLNESLIQNGSFNSLITQDSNNLLIGNCTFLQITFQVYFIRFSGNDGVAIENSLFSGISGQIYIFVMETSNFLTISESILELINCYAIFYALNANLNYNYQIILTNSYFGFIWDQDLTYILIMTTFSSIYNNTVTGSFFQDLSIPDLNFISNNNYIVNNSFLQLLNTAGMIQTQMGTCTLNQSTFIDNFFLHPNSFRYLFEISISCYFLTIDCLFKDNGIIQKKFQYFGYNDNNMIALWSIYYSYFHHIVMIATDRIELLGGFISASPHSGLFELTNSTLIYNITNTYFEYKGIQLDTFISATMINNTFYNLKCNSRDFATSYGAICLFATSNYLYSKGENQYWVYMKNNTFYNSSCVYGGGLAIFGVNNITIIDTIFDGSQTEIRGGSMILVGSESCIIKNLLLNNSFAFRGGGLYVQNIFSMEIENLTMMNIIASETGVFYIKDIPNFSLKGAVTLNTEVGSEGGVFYVYRSFFNLQMANITNTNAGIEGGTFFCDDRSVVTIDQINITNSFSINAGVFSIASATFFNLTNAFINNGSSSSDAAVVLLTSFQNSLVANLIITNSRSISGRGIFYIQDDDDDSNLNIINLTCINNFANDGSCILYEAAILLTLENIYIIENGNTPLYLFGSVTVSMVASNISILSSKSATNIIYLSNIELLLDFILITENEANSDIFFAENTDCIISDGIFLDNSNFRLFNFQTSIIELSEFEINGQTMEMSYLQSSSSTVLCFNVEFYNGYFNDESGLMNFASSTFSATGCFFGNISGEVFHFVNSPSIQFSESFFFNNTSFNPSLPNDIFIDNEGGYFTELLINSSKIEVFYGFSAYFSGNAFTNLINSIFINMNMKDNNQAFQILSNLELAIIDSKILNFTESALYILNSITSQRTTLLIQNSIFNFNSAPRGSCLNIEGDMIISISNCSFFNNTAILTNNQNKELEGVAPCVYFKPNFVGSSQINVTISIFENNTAEFIAPTIFSQNPISFDQNTVFRNNIDSLLFTNKAFTLPLAIKLSQVYSEQIMTNFLNSSDTNNLVEFNSGTAFNLEFVIQDNFQQTLIFDNQSIFTIKKVESNISLNLQNFLSQSIEGAVAFGYLIVKIVPNSTFNLEISGLFTSLTNDVLPQELTTTINFHSRNCLLGEIITSDFSCVKCSENTYSLADPMIVQLKYQQCLICPDSAECDGGDQITPLPGYYRYSNLSTQMTACLNADSCIGNANQTFCDSACLEDIKIHGGCRLGNSGPLCANCDEDYGKYDETSTCEQCASLSTLIIFRLIGYVGFMCIYLLFNSYLAEHHDSSKGKRKAEPSVFLKILINHTQQISLIALKGVAIPISNIQSLFSVVNYVSFTNDQVVNNECVFGSLYGFSTNSAMSKIILNTLFPLFLSCFALLIWSLISYISHKLNEPNLKNTIISKFLLFTTLSVFMLYPLITKSCFSLLECMKLDPDQDNFYLQIDLSTECWGKSHIGYIFMFSVPGLIVWGIGFPLFLCFLLRKNVQISTHILSKSSTVSLKNPNFKNADSFKSYAFFYRGYLQKYYYWESIILFRKFLLCLMSTLTDSLVDENKWMIILILMLIFLFFTLKLMPYSYKMANYLEIMSLIICAFSAFACFVFNSNESSDLKGFLAAMMIIINIAFYVLSLWILAKLYLETAKEMKQSMKAKKIKMPNKMKSKDIKAANMSKKVYYQGKSLNIDQTSQEKNY